MEYVALNRAGGDKTPGGQPARTIILVSLCVWRHTGEIMAAPDFYWDLYSWQATARRMITITWRQNNVNEGNMFNR